MCVLCWYRTQEVFAATVEGDASSACYMRTGDLGFVNEKGELFVTGRLKDLIIVRGRNVYPLDIEWTIHSASDLVRPGCCAVFSVQLEGHDEEKVVAVAELRQPVADAKARDDLVLSIKTAVARAFDGLELHDVVLVKEHTVPKTSSGKLMRFACRYSYLQASLARLDSNTSSGTGGRNAGAGTGAGGSGDGAGSGAGRAVKIAGDITATRDYPARTRNLRLGKSVVVVLTVGTDGRVHGCRIHQASPDPEADAITCRLATERFRFRPATDRAGNPIASEFGWQQRWFAP